MQSAIHHHFASKAKKKTYFLNTIGVSQRLYLSFFSRFTHSLTTEKCLLGHYASSLLQTSCSFKHWGFFLRRRFRFRKDWWLIICRSDNSAGNATKNQTSSLFYSKVKNGQCKNRCKSALKIQQCFLYLRQQVKAKGAMETTMIAFSSQQCNQKCSFHASLFSNGEAVL